MNKKKKKKLWELVGKMSLKDKKRNEVPALTKYCGKVFRLKQDKIKT